MFQISTNAIPARASMERVATWPGPSTASAPTAANWTPQTPSAWVRRPSTQAPGPHGDNERQWGIVGSRVFL